MAAIQAIGLVFRPVLFCFHFSIIFIVGTVFDWYNPYFRYWYWPLVPLTWYCFGWLGFWASGLLKRPTAAACRYLILLVQTDSS
jgi:hypothetical protein